MIYDNNNNKLASHASHLSCATCGPGIAIQPKVCQRQTTAIGSQHTRKNKNLIMESNADSVEAMMEAGAVAVAGGVAAIGSSLAVRRGTSTTKILPAKSKSKNSTNSNKKPRKKRPRRMISRIRSKRTKIEKRLEKKYPKIVFFIVTLRVMLDILSFY